MANKRELIKQADDAKPLRVLFACRCCGVILEEERFTKEGKCFGCDTKEEKQNPEPASTESGA